MYFLAALVAGVIIAWLPLAGQVALFGSATILVALMVCGTRQTIVGLFAVSAFLLPATAFRVGDLPVTFGDVFLVLPAVLLPFDSQATLQRILHVRAIRGVAAIAVAAVAALLFAPVDLLPGLVVSGRLVGVSVVTVGLIAWLRPTQNEAVKLLYAFATGTTASIVAGYIGPFAGSGRLIGWANNPNEVAITAVISVGVIGYFSLAGVGSSQVNLGIIAICLAGVLSSGSRAGLLGVAATGTIMAHAYWRRRRRMWPLLVVVGLAGLAVVTIPALQESQALQRLFESNEAVSRSDAEHLQSLALGIERGSSNPILGAGFTDDDRPHNVYVEVWSSIGVLGLLGWLYVCWRSARPAFTWPRRSGTPALTAASTAWIGYLAIMLFQNALWNRYVWFLVGIIGTLLAESRAEDSPDVHVKPNLGVPDDTPANGGLGSRPAC